MSSSRNNNNIAGGLTDAASLVLKEISSYLSEEDNYHLARLSNHSLFHACKHTASQLVKDLLLATVRGDEAAVMEIIDKNPGLLHEASRTRPRQAPIFGREQGKTYTGNIKEHTGKIYNGLTAFQLALCVGDTDMCEKLVSYFEGDAGQRNKLTQMIHVFAEDGFDMRSLNDKTNDELLQITQDKLTYHQKRQASDTYFFEGIAEVISNATAADVTAQLQHQDNGSTLNQAMLTFRDEFTNLSASEAVFNPQHLLKAMQVYTEQFNNWSWDQRDLFWRQVIGFAQRDLPVCYLQAFCQGLYNLIREDNPESLKRSTKIHNFITDRAISLDKLDDDVVCRLGYDFAVYSRGATDGAAPGWLRDPRAGCYFQNLCRAKTASLEKLCSRADLRVGARPGVSFSKVVSQHVSINA